MTVTVPRNVAQLNERLTHVALRLEVPVARARLMLCTLIVSQMLPDTVAIKGGMGVKLRLGNAARAQPPTLMSLPMPGEQPSNMSLPIDSRPGGERFHLHRARSSGTQMHPIGSPSPPPYASGKPMTLA